MGARRRKQRTGAVAKTEAASPGRALDEGARARRAMRMVVVFYLFLAASYVLSIPFGKGPDESAHVRYIEYLADRHWFPVFDREHPDPNYEFHQPPLYYSLCLPTYLLAGRDRETAGKAVRLFTALVSVALIYLTFALGRSLAPDKPWAAVASAGVVAFLPMQLGIASSIGNDALTEVLCAAALLLLVRYLRAASRCQSGDPERPLGPGTMGIVGLMIGLGMLTKSIAVLLFPAAWVAAGLAARRGDGYRWRQLGRDLALVTGAALLVSGWWLVRNQLKYGDLLAQKAFLDAFQGLRPSPQDVMATYQGHFAPETHLPVYLGVVASWTLASTLGVFGPTHGNHFVFFPAWVYMLYGLVGAAGAWGFVWYLSRATLADWQRQAWWICGLFGALLLASFVRFNFLFFQAQARYLFPVLPAAAIAFCLGLQAISPAQWRHWVLLASVLALALLAFVGLPLWIAPRFLAL